MAYKKRAAHLVQRLNKDSILRTIEELQWLEALAREWEEAGTDPDYLRQLHIRVSRLKTRLTHKGILTQTDHEMLLRPVAERQTH